MHYVHKILKICIHTYASFSNLNSLISIIYGRVMPLMPVADHAFFDLSLFIQQNTV